MSSPARRVIAVASGKGGVGKTTVSVNLAVALADAGHAVGLVDADLYGPDVPLMFGLTRRAAASGIDVWTNPARRRRIAPVEALGVRLMSAQFLMGEDQSLAVHSTFVTMLLHRLLNDVAWGELDVLLVDLPPGTADIQQYLATTASLTGAIIVVTPQDVAHLDARKLLDLLGRAKVEVIGGVENMGPMACPCCSSTIVLFPPAEESRAIWSHGVRRLASIPFAPQAAADSYVPIVRRDPGAAAAQAFRHLASQVMDHGG